MEGEYVSREMPAASKSKIKTCFFFCPYLFHKTVILKEKEDKMGVRCDVGTDTHMIFAWFWNEVKSKYLFDEIVIDPVIQLEDNPITLYFYSICMTLTPEYDREVNVLQRIYWKFALLHTARFLYLYQLFHGNKIKVWKYFVPRSVEEFIWIPKYEIYGTIDTTFNNVDEKENITFYLVDYKTGKVPSDVLKGRKNVMNDLSIKLPPKFMFEVHFYALLEFLQKGWDFRDDRVRRFVLNDEYLEDGVWKVYELGRTKEEQKLLNKTKRNYLTSIQPKFKKFDELTHKWIELKHGDIHLGIIFLTGDPKIDYPVVVKKPFNYVSLRAALLKINMLRKLWFMRNYDEYYLVKEMKTLPEYNKYRCGVCSREEKCLKELELKFGSGEI